jgi:hypothetical protein
LGFEFEFELNIETPSFLKDNFVFEECGVKLDFIGAVEVI